MGPFKNSITFQDVEDTSFFHHTSIEVVCATQGNLEKVLGVKHKQLIINNMKSTKIMLAVIATILITWCVIGLIGWMLSDLSYKECMTNGGTLFCMLFIGWLPAIIVGSDLDKRLIE